MKLYNRFSSDHYIRYIAQKRKTSTGCHPEQQSCVCLVGNDTATTDAPTDDEPQYIRVDPDEYIVIGRTVSSHNVNAVWYNNNNNNLVEPYAVDLKTTVCFICCFFVHTRSGPPLDLLCPDIRAVYKETTDEA